MLAIGACLLYGYAYAGHAQQTAPVVNVAGSLSATPRTAGASGFSGAVFDANGAAIAGASVTLTAVDGSLEKQMLSGDQGQFRFDGLPASTFRLSISAAGMASFSSAPLALALGESRQLTPIVLAVLGATTQVEVRVTQTEIAQEQVKAAEQQRVFGILPNFYSSYIWNAAPLNTRQKFDLAFHSLTDPMAFLGTGIAAGAEQATNTFSGYGQGASGYAKRYGASYTDEALSRLLGSAILPSLFHQDPRYFYKGSGSTRSRAIYAMTRSIITRGDNGRPQPNYSHILGSLAAGGIANAYYPPGDRGVGLVLGNALLGTAGRAVENLAREFFLRQNTPSVPAYANGKP
jgi:hypothetical protein